MALFGLVLLAQEELITKHCFGDCGKVLIGGIDGGEFGPLFPCRQAVCPHAEKELGPIGDVDGEQLFIRKLKEES